MIPLQEEIALVKHELTDRGSLYWPNSAGGLVSQSRAKHIAGLSAPIPDRVIEEAQDIKRANFRIVGRLYCKVNPRFGEVYKAVTGTSLEHLTFNSTPPWVALEQASRRGLLRANEFTELVNGVETLMPQNEEEIGQYIEKCRQFLRDYLTYLQEQEKAKK